MTREEIIRARGAYQEVLKHWTFDDLVAFTEKIVKHEREQCARIVESYTGAWDDQGYALAQKIRGRK
jgi:hypothetical protein